MMLYTQYRSGLRRKMREIKKHGMTFDHAIKKLRGSIDISHLKPDQQQRVRLFVKGLESDT